MKLLCLLLLPLLLNACSTLQKEQSLFSQLGAKAGIAKLTDAFIEEIQYDKQVLPYFLDSDIHRFRSKFIEQICMISGGPCEYTGDSMEDIHAGMQINEHHFNALVDDLIRAMEAIDLPVQTQNQLLSLLAPMRKEIIYR
jgi:hemoglobin